MLPLYAFAVLAASQSFDSPSEKFLAPPKPTADGELGRALEAEPISAVDMEIVKDLKDDPELLDEYLKSTTQEGPAEDSSWKGRFLKHVAVHVSDCKSLAMLALASCVCSFCAQGIALFVNSQPVPGFGEFTTTAKVCTACANIVGFVATYKIVNYVFFAETPEILWKKGGLCAVVVVLGVCNAIGIICGCCLGVAGAAAAK